VPVSKGLKESMHYYPDTGIFKWKINKQGNVKAGNIAGSLKADGYISIFFNGKAYKAHRLAWLYMTGSLPKHQIDHINHDRIDNRWINLREATTLDNNRNQSLRKNNTSGFTGVFWMKSRNKWIAQITVKRKDIHLGCFDDLSEAIAKRQTANVLYGFHANHGELSCQ